MADWIESRMGSHGVRPDAGVGTRIVALAGPTTESRVGLAAEVFARGTGPGTATLADVDEAFDSKVRELASTFEIVWSDQAISQKRLLRAVADGVDAPYSEQARADYTLPTPNGITKAIRVLRSKGILASVGRIRIVDPFFAAWIRLRAMPESTGA